MESKLKATNVHLLKNIRQVSGSKREKWNLYINKRKDTHSFNDLSRSFENYLTLRHCNEIN